MERRSSEPIIRKAGGTEYSWCKAVPVGTGITLSAILFSTSPEVLELQKILQELQVIHPILRSKLVTSKNSLHFLIHPSPFLQITVVNQSSTSDILLKSSTETSPLQFLCEYEMNKNSWTEKQNSNPIDTFFATLYLLPCSRSALVLRIHTSICDRTSAGALLKEMKLLMGKRGKEIKCRSQNEIPMSIEDMIPTGKANKPFWTRGIDLVGYSLNSFRFNNLPFSDVSSSSPRSSAIVKLQMNKEETDRLLTGCKARGIKLCAAMAAAGLISAISTKQLSGNQYETYAVVTLVNCRKILDPVLDDHDIGFYHSAILNTYNICPQEKLWDLANRCYKAYSNSMKNKKHFTDMGDLNFLMCKAIENPSLTPSSSMRTSFITVFEESSNDDDPEENDKRFELEDYMCCSSVHGVGPSIAVFDTIRNGCLDCVCVYPSPLHSRTQIKEVLDRMKKILLDGCN